MEMGRKNLAISLFRFSRQQFTNDEVLAEMMNQRHRLLGTWGLLTLAAHWLYLEALRERERAIVVAPLPVCYRNGRKSILSFKTDGKEFHIQIQPSPRGCWENEDGLLFLATPNKTQER
jgi:hypothetical protein